VVGKREGREPRKKKVEKSGRSFLQDSSQSFLETPGKGDLWDRCESEAGGGGGDKGGGHSVGRVPTSRTQARGDARKVDSSKKDQMLLERKVKEEGSSKFPQVEAKREVT